MLSTSSSGYSRDRPGPSTRLCLARPRDDGRHDSESPEGEAQRQGEGTRHSQSYEVVRLRCLSQHRLISPSRSLSPERLHLPSARGSGTAQPEDSELPDDARMKDDSAKHITTPPIKYTKRPPFVRFIKISCVVCARASSEALPKSAVNCDANRPHNLPRSPC